MSISFAANGAAPSLLGGLLRRMRALLWRSEPAVLSEHAYRVGMIAHDDGRPCIPPQGTPAWQDTWRLGWKAAELGDETW